MLGTSIGDIVAISSVASQLGRWGSASWSAPNVELVLREFGVIACKEALIEERFLSTVCQYESEGVIASAHAWIKKKIYKAYDLGACPRSGSGRYSSLREQLVVNTAFEI
jgi:hypothetical protein